MEVDDGWIYLVLIGLVWWIGGFMLDVELIGVEVGLNKNW